jgi:topoisomerase-4 subunit A
MGMLLIKGRQSGGNRVTKEIIQKIVQKEVGGSTLAARKIWYDDVVGRLNDEERGTFLGSFKGEDKILTLYKSGDYRLSSFDLSNHFDEDMIHIEKWHPERAISAVYYDGEKELHYVKRFTCEVTTDKKVSFISEGEGSYLDVVTTVYRPVIKIIYNKLLKETKNLPDNDVNIADFIDVKGLKAQGNQLTKLKVKEIVVIPGSEEETNWPEERAKESTTDESFDDDNDTDDEVSDGTTVEWDLTKGDDDDEEQMKLF